MASLLGVSGVASDGTGSAGARESGGGSGAGGSHDSSEMSLSPRFHEVRACGFAPRAPTRVGCVRSLNAAPPCVRIAP